MDKRISLSGESPDAAVLAEYSGIGLIRGEFIFRQLCAYSNMKPALDTLTNYLSLILRRAGGKSVWYRLSDFWSDEANTLDGNELRLHESNPIVGIRGIRRGLMDREHFHRELGVLLQVQELSKNLGIIVPFVQDAKEFEMVSGLLRDGGWRGPVGSMIEIPSALFEAAALVDAGATNLLIGMNDLSCLMLGRERGEPSLKMHRAIWGGIGVLSKQIGRSVEWGVAGNLTPELAARAEEAGARYISIHYADLPKFGVDSARLPELDLVREIKDLTRRRKGIVGRTA